VKRAERPPVRMAIPIAMREALQRRLPSGIEVSWFDDTESAFRFELAVGDEPRGFGARDPSGEREQSGDAQCERDEYLKGKVPNHRAKDRDQRFTQPDQPPRNKLITITVHQ